VRHKKYNIKCHKKSTEQLYWNITRDKYKGHQTIKSICIELLIKKQKQQQKTNTHTHKKGRTGSFLNNYIYIKGNSLRSIKHKICKSYKYQVKHYGERMTWKFAHKLLVLIAINWYKTLKQILQSCHVKKTSVESL
jgi:hypothetical protein